MSNNNQAPNKPVQVSQEFIRVLTVESNALLEAANRFKTDHTKVLQAIQTIHERTLSGGRVIVMGIGKSGKIGQKIASTFSSTGTPATFVHPTEAMHGDLGEITEQDTVLAISYSGHSNEILSLIPFFQSKTIPVILLTGKIDSKLASSASIIIDASVSAEACPHQLAPTSSSTLALAIGDALALTLMQVKGFSSSDFAMNHPGGSLGRRLLLKAEQVMHAESNLPLCGLDTTAEEVIDIVTKFQLGCVLVVDENQKLLGLITDGDIRRALSKKNAFFDLKAENFMTKTPQTTQADILAAEVLQVMEAGPRPLNVIPVIDKNLTAIGVVRLHDLIQAL